MPMKKKIFMAGAIAALFCLLLTSTAGLSVVSFVEANFHFAPPSIAINSPANGATYNSSDVSVDLAVTPGGSFPYSPTFAICRLDGGSPINLTFLNPDHRSIAKYTFDHVSQGSHTLTVEVHIVTFVNTEFIYNAGSTFNVDSSTPNPTATPTPTPPPSPSPTQQPSLSIHYPLNNSFFNVSLGGVNCQLIYETNSTLSWVGYSIGGNGYSIEGKGSGNVTVSENSTWVHDLGSNGYHTLTLYANDTSGKWANPQTVTYLVNFYPDYPPSPSPTIEPTLEPTQTASPTPIGEPILVAYAPQIVVATVALIAVVAVGAMVYFKRRKGKP